MPIIRRIVQTLGQLNFFADVESINKGDPQVLREQILSTRVYIVLMMASIWILLTTISLSARTNTIVAPEPSISTYKRLQEMYPVTLSCRCQKITVPYSDFLSIKVIFHQVRNSITVVS